MIRLGVLFPDHLNLNGDLGNMEVISKQLDWRGIAHEVIRVETEQQLASDLSFLLIGHGSNAAWEAIREPVGSLSGSLRSLIEAGLPGLCVSTGFEELVRLSVLTNFTLKSMPERVSKFVVHADESGDILGYLNTDVDLPNLHRQGQFVCTMLHGPVLAKNPKLLNELLLSICFRAGVTLGPILEDEKAGLLADLVDEVWKLEQDLASE